MIEPGAHTATLLPNGKVLITKCVDYCYDAAKPSHAELYDPSTGTFARTGGDMVDALQGARPKATLLMNGKVLVAGGDLDVMGSAIAQIYDPAAGVFVSTGKMTADIEQGQPYSCPTEASLSLQNLSPLRRTPVPGRLAPRSCTIPFPAPSGHRWRRGRYGGTQPLYSRMGQSC